MKGEIVLLISAVGFEDKTITVPSSSTSVGIQLTSGTPLSEVVVTSFGVKQQKKTLGFSTTELSTKQLLESRQPNLINALQGRVAGVQVNSTGGGPGQGARIVIRGNQLKELFFYYIFIKWMAIHPSLLNVLILEKPTVLAKSTISVSSDDNNPLTIKSPPFSTINNISFILASII